jgi:glyoxylase I family protein
MTQLEGFHHVAVTVTDRDRSARWYAEVLGFEEEFREEADHRRACVMRFPGGSYSVGLVEHVPGDASGFDPRRLGLDHLAFTVATRDDLDWWARRLTDAGVTHSGPIDIPPGAILNFDDPDGVKLALFWDRPV